MDSPFLIHLGTNYVPSDFEKERIQTDLIPPAMEEYLRLDSLIRDLAIQRSKIQDYIDSHKALISPARRIPYDLVRSIFLACLPSHRNAVMAPTEAPLILGHICSAWRTIALSTATLWASIHIPLEFIFADKRRVSALTEWLGRSMSCPLSLSIVGDGQTERDPALVTAAMKFLLGSSDRWQQIELSGLRDPCALQIADAYASMLEVVCFRDILADIPNFNILKGTRLIDVTLRAYRLELPVSGLCPAADNLRYLSLNAIPYGMMPGMKYESILRMLSRLPRLVSLLLFVGDHDGFHGDTTIVLPYLEEFGIGASHVPDISSITITQLLEHLVMPQLRTLRIPLTQFPVRSTPVFTSLCARSPLITNLTIHLGTFTRYTLFEMLRALSSIVTLDVHDPFPRSYQPNYPNFDALLDLLTPTDDSFFCPWLAKLALFNISSVSDEILFRFLERRAENTHTLESLRLHFFSAAHVTTLDLQPFIDRGIHILVHSPPSAPAQSVSGWTGLDNSTFDA